MAFLKKHYEKILLGAVLLGLAVVVGFLPIKISNDRQAIQDKAQGLTHPKPKPLTNLDMTMPEGTLKRVASPAIISFSAPNKLFNPMPWQKAADGSLIPFDDQHIGPKALTVTKIIPLYTKI